jgi:hypothetical protein
MMTDRAAMLAELDELFAQLIDQQREKLRGEATRRDPTLTDDDLDQPHDFPALANDPAYQYEDGLLAGYRAAHMAVRAQLSAPKK